jgi:gliding motility-associated-like protein
MIRRNLVVFFKSIHPSFFTTFKPDELAAIPSGIGRNVNFKSRMFKWGFILAVLSVISPILSGQTNTLNVAGNTNWNTPAAWSLGHIPLAAEDAVVTSTADVTVTINVATAVCKSLIINQGTRVLTLNVSGNTLNVTNGITLNAPTGGTRATTLAIGTGNVNCASVTSTDAGNINRTNAITISSGSLNVTGSLAYGPTAACNLITCTGTGLISVGGTFSAGTFTCGTGTVNFNAAGAQSIGNYTYYNLTLSGSGLKTITGGTVNGTLSMEGTTTASAAPTYGATATLQYKGSAAQASGPEFPASVYNLIVNNSNGLTLSGSKTVTNNLIMTIGNIYTGANTLSLSNSLVGSLLYSSGTIVGKFKRSISTTPSTDYLFPLGTATFYRPASFNFSSIASAVDITSEFIAIAPAGLVSYIDGTASVDNLFTEGYWRFSSSALPAVTYTISLTGNGFVSYAINQVTRISGRDNLNTTWRALGSHGTLSSNTVTRINSTNLNTTSFDYAFGTGCQQASVGYEYERNITIDYTKVAGNTDLNNFPVLINLTGQTYLQQPPAGRVYNTNGYDIIFTDDDYNQLDHQIEYYNGISGDLVAWVRIPVLSRTTNTVIKILYGNPGISTNPSTTSVWDTHYRGVWHLDNNSLNDFTSYNKSGTPFNSPTYPSGTIYNSLGLNGGNQYVQVINAPNTNFSGNVTVSAWIYLNGLGLDQKISGNQNGAGGGYKFGVYTNNKVEFEIRDASNNPYLNRGVAGGTTLTTGQWYYVAGISSDVLDSINTVVNGVPERFYQKAGILGASSNNLTIGREPWTGSYYWNGRIDELRISDEVRSSGWLRTEYNNQSSPSTFYTVDAAESTTSNLPSTSMCLAPVTLTFGYPSGGTYSGNPYIAGNVFTPPSAGTYTITYTYTSGCGTTNITKDLIIEGIPSAPTAPDKEYCVGSIAYLNTTSGVNVRWYEGGLFVSNANPFSTGKTAAGIYNYTVTQTIDGCESATTPVKLTIFSSTSITSQPSSASRCVGQNVSFAVSATGPNLSYQWRKGAVNLVDGGTVSGATTPTLSITNVQLTDAGNYTCVVTSSCGPLPSNIAVLTIDIQPIPSISGNNAICPYLTGVIYSTPSVVGHTYSWTVTGGTINGSSTGNSIIVDWGGPGTGIVAVTETVSAGCFTTTPDYPVVKSDVTLPVILTCPSNISINAAAGSCTGVATWTEPVGSDNCTASGSLIWNKNHSSGDSFPIGTTTVTYTAQDATGNTSLPCSFNVTVNDNQLPTIIAPANLVVSNDAGVCTASGISLGVPVTADNCTVAGVTNDAPATYPLGITTVTWTVTDASGNSATAAQTVTINDTEAPVARCKTITVYLDITGNATITPANIDNGSTDNCSIASMSALPNTFNISNIGSNNVTLSVTDPAGNTGTCIAVVVVLDNLPPTAICKNATVQLGAGGTVTITGADVDNGSSDPDGIASLTVAPNTFNCSNLGANSVVLTVTDNAGKSSTCSATVTVQDNILPTLVCPGNINTFSDAASCGATVNYITPVGTDNCSVTTTQTAGLGSGSVFPIGTTTNTFIATDASGNTATCSFNVTVSDNTAPVITLPAPPVLNANAVCQATMPAIAATFSDNCTSSGSIITSQVPAAGTIINLGITPVTITATDLVGNTSNSVINVTVIDASKPVITPPADVILNLDNSCSASVPNFLTGLLVNDNCTPSASITTSQKPVAGTPLSGTGTTNVKIYATDAAGNKDSVTVVVTTKDITPPTVLCKDINLYLNGSGSATLTSADVNNGSADNCTVILTYLLSRTSFSCSDIGSPVAVTLTGYDATGNSSFCTSQVTVLDTIKPVVLVKTFNLVLDASGSGTLLPSDVDNGSYDNCGPVTLSVSPNTFSCSDQGPQTVILTALDSHGNSRSKSVVITVSSSLNIIGPVVNSCDVAAPYALYLANVSGGSGVYTYFWDCLESGAEPFIYFDAIFPYLHFSSTSSSSTPFYNNLMPDGTYNIRLVVTDGNGCRDTSVLVLNKGGMVFNNVTVNYSNACEGQVKTYSVPFDATATYSWNVTNGVFTTPTNTNTVDVQWDLGATMGVVVGNSTKPDLLGNPCGSSVVDTVTIHTTPVPLFNSPTLSVCANSVYTYTLTSIYASYSWTITGGAITGGGTGGDNYVTIRWGAGAAGKITVVATSASSCSGSVFIDVAIFNLSGSVISKSDVTCNGASDGQVTVAATTGTGLAPYLYSLDGGAFGASGSFAGISVGNHNITIQDALLCTFDVPFTITQPTLLLGSVSSQTNVTCNGGSDGSVTVAASGGVIPYSYNIDGGAFQGSATFNGLTAGLHTVLVQDANLCTKSIPVTITQPSALSGSITAQTNVDCNGNSTGSFSVLGSGGTPGYQYSLDGGPFQASGNFIGLAAGSYTITVRDASLCTFSLPVTITQPLILSGAISSQTNVTCFGGSDGQVTIVGAGGTPGYEYNIDGGSFQVSPTFIGLLAGSHIVTIRDANLCTATVPVTITEPAVLVATASSNSPVCETATLTLTGGPNGMTTYSWTGPNGFTSLSQSPTVSASATAAMAGVYTLTVINASGCTVQANTNVVITPLNTVSAPSSTPTLCINTLMTSITHTTTGATGIGVAAGLPAGVTAAFATNTITISGTPTASGIFNYTIPLTGGCGSVSATGTITVTADNTVSAPSSTPTLCINTVLTNITHTTTGATGIGAATGLPGGVTASFAANTITISGTPTASGIFNYTIPLTGGCGSVNATGTITVTAANTVTAPSSTPTLCINTVLTNITHTTTGATGIGAATGLPAGVTAAFAANTITISGTPTASGIFNYTIPLTGGCGSVNATGTITVTAANTITAPSSTPTLCINTVLTNITHTTTGATGIGVAAGLPAGVTAAFAANTITISGTPTASGIFNYTIPLTGGCGSVNATGTITVTAANTVTAPSSTPTLCINTVLTNITHTTTGATGIGVAAGLPAGVTASFAANTITISGTPTASGIFNYTIPLTGGCGSVNATGTITVTAANSVGAPSSTPTLCINTLMTNITHATTGATGIGVAAGLPAGVTASWAANTITISGTPTASGIFNYTIPLTGGCGSVNATGTITVTAANTVTAPSSTPTLCINTVLTNITHTTTGATGIGVAAGLPAGVTAAFAANTITISGTPTASGIFNYTIPLTGGCGSVNATGTITVTADNTVSAPSSTPTLCINTVLTNITHTTTGATGIGVAAGLPAGVTAAFAANTITISGTPTASGIFNYTIPLTGGCGSVNATGTITVTAANTVGAPSSTPTLCINTLMTNITHATTGATGIGVAAGLPAGVTASWAANTITISGTPTASGIFNYTIPLTGGCGSVNATGTITVNSGFTTSTTVTNVLCFGGNTGAIDLTVTGGTAPFTYLWSNGAVTQDINSLTSGTYTVTITDATCTGNASATITQPAAAVSGSISSQTNVLCNGDNTGSVIIAGAGGVPPYLYKLDAGAFQISGTFNSLTAGAYTVTIQDANLCTGTLIATITQPAAISAAVSSQTNVACYGASTGSISILASGGTAPYQYSINAGPYQALNTFVGLIAGSYNISVRDANLCITGFSVSITQPGSALSGFITAQTSTTCFGDSDGSVTVSGSGGTTPYLFNIDGGPFQVSGTFNGLAAGAHTVIVQDANLCGQNVNVVITQPAPLTGAIVSQTNVLCFGGSTGSVTLSAAGGTSPYQYSIDGGAYQSSGTFNGLIAGAHIISVQDIKLCTTIVNLTITQPAVLSVTTTQVNVLCFGGSNGSATAIPAGGTSPYSYAWSTIPIQTAVTATGLTAGTYSVNVTDANGCTALASVTITQPVTMSGSTAVTNILCNGGSTGTVTLTVSGGTSPYTYLWNNGATTKDLAGLTAGTYTVTITDANGCTTNASGTVTEPPILTGTISSQTNVLCFGGNNGSVTVAGSGGTAGYMYRIGVGAYQASGTFSTLTAGSYTITVRDVNFCTAPVPVTITQPVAGLTASVGSQTNVLCFGDATGSVTIAAVGGTTPYEYNIDGGTYQPSSTFSSLLAGVHTVIVRDANLCMFSLPVNISQPLSALSGSIVSQTNVLCFGGSTGSVTVAGSGGTAPYQYSIDAGPYQVLGTFNGMSVGVHTVKILDTNGCFYNIIVNITQPAAALTVTTTKVDVLCFGAATGSATALPAGGTPPYDYSWSTLPVQTGATATALVAGTYTVTVTDNNLCSTPASVIISQPLSAITGSATVITAILCNGGTGTVTLTGAGGTAPLSYTFNGVTNATGVFSGITVGAAYAWSITDANACTPVTGTLAVTEPPVITGSATVTTAILCNGGTGTVTLTGAGGTAPLSYTFNGVTNATGVFNGITVGAAYAWSITDANACAPATGTLAVTEPPVITGSATVTTAILCNGGTGTVTLTGAGGTAPLSYTFNGVTNATGVFNGITVGAAYAWSITDANACTPVTGTLAVTEPAVITGSATVTTPILCKGGTGTVTLTGAGGTAPLSYTFNGVTNATGVFNGIAAGAAYAWSITDANACAPATGTLAVTEPAIITGSATVTTAILCNGGTGTVTLTGAGGTAPLSYTFNGVTNGTGVFSGIIVGAAYAWSITDANACAPATGTLAVTEPAIITGSATVTTAILCNGGTGTVTLTGAGGTAPLSYTFNGVTNGTGVFSGIIVGAAYAWSITDANACTPVTGTLAVIEPPVITGSASVTTPILCNGGTGTVTLTGAGGTAPLSYTFNGVTNATGVFSGIAAGAAYAWSIIDANACAPVTGTLAVSEPTALTGSILAQTDVTIYGGNDGSVTVGGSGGTAPYMYNINGGAFQVSGIFSTLTAGSYTVAVEDANLCTFFVPVTITQPLVPLSGTITSQTNVLCFGASTGSVTVTGLNGVTPYEYSINAGPYQPSGIFNSLAAGTYAVTVRDALMSTFIVNVTISQPAAAIAIVTSQTDVLCSGGVNGSATATVSGGTSPYTYSWNSSPVQTTATASGLKAGTYIVNITDANGCPATASVTITQPSNLIVTTTKVDALCNGGATGTATATPAGGTAPYAYSWNTTPVQTTATATGLASGAYIVTLTDANLCNTTASVTIGEPALMVLDPSVTETACPDSHDGSITISVTGGTSPYTVFWSDPGAPTSLTRTGLDTATYSVVVSDVNACAKSLNVVVGFIGGETCLMIPQIITPNGDGANDEWVIRNIDLFPNAEVFVYTRWGKLIYHSKNISADPWDGRFKGKLMPTDSYHYILKLGDGSDPRSGIISIIR